MNLAEKFANLSVEQQKQMREIKNVAGLDAFLVAEGITLSAEAHAEVLAFFNTGIKPLNDDDLDAVAGGQDKDYKAKAYADGRTVPIEYRLNTADLPFFQRFCSCFIEEAWAARRGKTTREGITGHHIMYYDCKCYRCGHSQATYKAYLQLDRDGVNIPQ